MRDRWFVPTLVYVAVVASRAGTGPLTPLAQSSYNTLKFRKSPAVAIVDKILEEERHRPAPESPRASKSATASPSCVQGQSWPWRATPTVSTPRPPSPLEMPAWVPSNGRLTERICRGWVAAARYRAPSFGDKIVFKRHEDY